MAKLDLKLDLVNPMRKGVIEGLCDLVDVFPNFRYAVILELLRRDDVSRCMFAEAFGERTLEESAQDAASAAIYAANKGEGCSPPNPKSWDQIAREVLAELQDTPGGRGEVG